MEDATIHWFNLLQEAEVGLSWTKLKRELIGRYGDCTSDDLFEEDFSSTGSIDEYLAEFESSHLKYCTSRETISGLFFCRIEIEDLIEGSHLQRSESSLSHAPGSRCGGKIARKGIAAWRRSMGLEKQSRLGYERLRVGLSPTQGIQTKPLSVGSSSPHESCFMT
ncbi:hypothetical protein V8G54_022528 [Vigna mungo]|uniref:Retrotransposon gag domain-containing protein n=1 Tax=Vigna mungo TaxID=3915 RepID=A0AAQ3N2U3_VIGMU